MLNRLVIILMVMGSTPCFADEVLGENVKNILKKSHTSEPNFLMVILSLFFVVCLIYLTGIIYAKISTVSSKIAKKQLKDFDDNKILVHSSIPLEDNKKLYVVEVDGKKMLIGASRYNIALIKDLTSNSDKEVTQELNEVQFNKTSEANLIANGELEVVENLEKAVDSEEELYKKYL